MQDIDVLTHDFSGCEDGESNLLIGIPARPRRDFDGPPEVDFNGAVGADGFQFPL